MSHSRLRPDYVALRSTSSVDPVTHAAVEWAVAEAKGTKLSLTNRNKCPTSWANQIRNVRVTVRGENVSIPRHLVVATRVNPNAGKPSTRRLQIRAWNRNEAATAERLPKEAVVEIAAANLFGLLRGLRLHENAQAIAFSAQLRAEVQEKRTASLEANGALEKLAKRAENELKERTTDYSAGSLRGTEFMELPIDTDFGTGEVRVFRPLTTLIQEFQRAKDFETAMEALRAADSELDGWVRSRKEADDVAWLPCGVVLRLPGDLESR